MKSYRTDLIIEAENLEAGTVGQMQRAVKTEAEGRGVTVHEEWNRDRSVKVTVVQIRDEAGARSIGRPVGTYITMELPNLPEGKKDLLKTAEVELEEQLRTLLQGKKGEHMLVVGLGNREVIADAVGPLTADRLMVTGHLFYGETEETAPKKYRRVSAFTPGVMAQTGVETMELIRGVVRQVRPDIVLAVDALAAKNPKRLNTTIQLTDTGISPGAGVGNNRKELNEASLGCPVIAIGVPTVLDASTIAKEEVSEDVAAFFVTPRNIDSSVLYVSELLAGGINRVNQKNGI